MDEMVEWNHQLKGHEFEQAPGDGEGQGSLAFCSPWGHKESETTDRLNNNNNPSCLSSTIFLNYTGLKTNKTQKRLTILPGIRPRRCCSQELQHQALNFSNSEVQTEVQGLTM